MLSRRRFLTLTAGLTATTFVAACAAPVAAPQAGQEQESGTQDAVPDAEDVTLVYWALQGENTDNNLTRGVVEPFEADHPGVTVDLQEIPWDGYYEKYQTLSAAGQAPDLAFVSAAWIQDFAKLGVALNLDPYAELAGVFGPDEADKYFLSTLDGLRYPGTSGSLYAIPYEWVTIAFYYNKDIFDAAGEDYPTDSWTYDDVLAAAQRLTQQSGDRTEQYGMISHWGYDVIDSSIHANGGSILNEDYSGAALDTPTNIETIQWWTDLINVHNVAPLPAEFADGGTVNLFASGRVAMAILGVWGIETFRPDADFAWDIAMMPVGKEMQTAVQWPNQVAIAAGTEHPEEAFNFALYMIRPDRPADTVGIGKVPVVKDLAFSEKWLEEGKDPANKEAILEMGDLNVPLEFGFRWTEWREAMDQELQLSYLGERPVEESVAAAHAAIQAVLDRP